LSVSVSETVYGLSLLVITEAEAEYHHLWLM